MSDETNSERLNRQSVEGLNARFGVEGQGFAGHEGRECREHRTVGTRAWCLDCSEWCYPHSPCVRCERPKMENELEKARAEIARLRAGEADDPGHMGTEPTPAQWLRRFNDRTPEERLFVAESVMARVRESEEQRRQDEGRIITLSNRVTALERNGNELFRNLQRARIILMQVRDLKERWATRPGMSEAHDDLEVALEYEEDPTGGGSECPTSCGEDCEVGALHCAEIHVVRWQRRHDPENCPQGRHGGDRR